MGKNALFFGDNLDVLRRHFKQDETVDLIYLDPPFNSNADYNVLFQEQDGSQAASQIKAFEDTWHWDQTAARAFEEFAVSAPHAAGEALQAFRTLLGCNDMLAYLSMMAPRLVELRRLLKPTGSLYLHCDPSASHYLKILMDRSSGPETPERDHLEADPRPWRLPTIRAGPRLDPVLHEVSFLYVEPHNEPVESCLSRFQV